MITKIIEDYRAQKELRHAFLKALKDDMRAHLKEHDIQFVDIPWRVKGESSLLRKVRKNPNTFKSISDVYDFCGLRVITYLREDIDKTIQVLGGRYQLSELTVRAPTDPTQFGYSSHHGRIRFHQASEFHRRYEGLYAEIQVRTILQHAWAEIEHDLGYKNDLGIPPHLRRRFSLLAGLLEIGDREFDELRVAIRDYVEGLEKKSLGEWSAISIDTHSLSYFCEHNPRLKEAANEVRTAASAAPYDDHDFLPNVAALEFLHIVSLNDLERLLKVNVETAVKIAVLHLAERGVQSQLADADLLDYLAICEASRAGLKTVVDLVAQVCGTGSEAHDHAYAEQWYNYFRASTKG